MLSIVLMTLISIFPTLDNGTTIELPIEIYSANQIEFSGEFIYVMNSRESGVYKLNSQGKLLASYVKNGEGPGEWKHIKFFKVFDGKIFVAHHMKNMFTVLSKDLEYIGETKEVFAGDLVVRDNGFYTSNFSSDDKTIIQYYDPDWEHIKKFGVAKEPYDLAIQKGELLSIGDYLYYIPKLHNVVQQYSLEGNLVSTFSVPGPTTNLVEHCDTGKANWFQNCPFGSLSRGHVDKKGRILFQFATRSMRRVFRLDLDTGTFEIAKVDKKPVFYADPLFYQLDEKDDGLLVLRSITLDFRPMRPRK